MAFYLILSLILIFPFYYLSFGVALFFYAALLVTGMIAKYRSMSILRWIAVIQAACSLALVAHLYQRYGIFVTLISVIVFIFLFINGSSARKRSVTSRSKRTSVRDIAGKGSGRSHPRSFLF